MDEALASAAFTEVDFSMGRTIVMTGSRPNKNGAGDKQPSADESKTGVTDGLWRSRKMSLLASGQDYAP
jgi:hypothetical protein